MRSLFLFVVFCFSHLPAFALLEGTTEWINGRGYKFKDGPIKSESQANYAFYTSEMRTRYPEMSVYFSWNPSQSSIVSTLPQIANMALNSTYSQDYFQDDRSSQVNKFKLGFMKHSSIKKYSQFTIDFHRYLVPQNYNTANRGLRLVTSSTDLYSFNYMTSIDCTINESRKICYGYNLSSQSMPGFQFTRSHASQNDVTITNSRDVLLGLHGLYSKVINDRLSMTATLSYDYGLGMFQNNTFRTNGSSHYLVNFLFERPFAKRMFFTTAVAYDKMTTPYSNGTDRWSTQFSNTQLELGFRWAYDSMNDITRPRLKVF